jgi:hypothetical protein
MTPAELASLAQSFLDAYVLGTPLDPQEALPARRLAGIRRRFPALLGLPPEYEPRPNGLDNTVFASGSGPESFPEPRARYLDRCPLERIVVTPTDEGAHLEFFFAVRYASRQFDPSIQEAVCLPSGDECSSIVSECLNRLQDFLGTDAELGGASDDVFAKFTSSVRILSNDDFLRLELPNVLPR